MTADGQLVSLGPHHGAALDAFTHSASESSHLHGYGDAQRLGRSASLGDLIALFEAQRLGRGLAPGWGPSTTWSWEGTGELRGVISLRHRPTPALEAFGGHIGHSVASSSRRRGVATVMLRGVLGRCRALDVARVLLTCDGDNRGSARTIELNGGQLEREAWHEGTRRMTRWYWIEVPA